MRRSMICRIGPAALAAGLLMCFSLVGCDREGRSSGGPHLQPSGFVGDPVVLATIGKEDEPTASDAARGDKPSYDVIFNQQGRGVAYIAKRKDAYHVVFNGKASQPVQSIDKISISEDGSRIAYSVMVDGTWGMVVDGRAGVPSDQVGDPIFSPDGIHLAYAFENRGEWFIAVDGRTQPACGSADCRIVFSRDSGRIAYIRTADETGISRFVISTLDLKQQASWGGIIRSTIIPNGDRTRVAAVRKERGKQRVVEISLDDSGGHVQGSIYDSIGNLVFGADGASLAYVAERQGGRFVVLNQKEETLPAGAIAGQMAVRPDGTGVGVLLATDEGLQLHHAFAGRGTMSLKYDEARDLVYDHGSDLFAFAARKGKNWFIVVGGNEGPPFDMVVAPLFSPDGNYLVYRVRHAGKRFVVIADRQGRIVRRHDPYELVFQPVFTSDGTKVAYGVKDGRKLIWQVKELRK